MDRPTPDAPLAERFVDSASIIGVAILAVTFASLLGLFRLDFSDSPRDIYMRDDEESRFLNEIHAGFGADDTDILVVLDGEDLLSRESLIQLNAFVERLRENENLCAVHSLFDARQAVKLGGRTAYWMIVPPLDREGVDYREVRDALLRHPLLSGRLLSPDGRTTIIVAQMHDRFVNIADIARIVDEVQTTVDQSFGDGAIRARLTGQPSLRVDTFHNLKSDQLKFSVICGATLFIIASLLFWRMQPVLLSLTGSGVGVLWTVGAMGWTGQRFDGINVVLPMLLFVIGFANSLHLILSLRGHRRAGRSASESVVATVHELGGACFLTSLTTAVGFGSLSLSSLESVHRFGVYAALGAVLSFLAVISIVPLSALLPWVRDLTGKGEREVLSDSRWFATAILPILRYPSLVSAIGVASIVLLAYAGTRVPFDMHWSEALPSTGDTVEAIRHLDDSLGGSVLAHVVLDWPDDLPVNDDLVLLCLADVQDTLETYAQPTEDRDLRLGRPSSLLTVLEGLRPPGESLGVGLPLFARRAEERFNKLVSLLDRQLLISVPLPEAGSSALLPIFNQMEADLQKVTSNYPGFTVRLTGSTVISARNMHDVLIELFESVSLAAVIVFLTLCFAFRSLRLGLVSVVPNTFPLVLVIAALPLLGSHMQVTAALTLCLCLGIAVDDTIHVIARFRREQTRGLGVRSACLNAYQHVGRVVVMTTVILVCGFSTMLLSDSPAIRLFGLLSCVALLAALVGDLIFLPALLVRWTPKKTAVEMSPHASQRTTPHQDLNTAIPQAPLSPPR